MDTIIPLPGEEPASINEDVHTKALGASEHCSCPASLATAVQRTRGRWSYSPVTDEDTESPQADIALLYNVQGCLT